MTSITGTDQEKGILKFIDPFEKELALIRNPIIKDIAVRGIALFPDYFYRVPASSTGKYHPDYALGDGGLYRHVRASIGIAVDLFRVYNFTPDEEDLIVASLLLHDGWKQGTDGRTRNTVHTHPIIASEAIWQGVETSTDQEKIYLTIICGNIASHMGKWSTSDRDATVLPTPITEMEKFVHLCDYLASRKDLTYNFNVRE